MWIKNERRNKTKITTKTAKSIFSDKMKTIIRDSVENDIQNVCIYKPIYNI